MGASIGDVSFQTRMQERAGEEQVTVALILPTSLRLLCCVCRCVALCSRRADAVCGLQVERGELEEFEILEQYADDNASFLSSLSTVNAVLQDKHALKTQRATNR